MELLTCRNGSASPNPTKQLVFRMNENGTGSETVRAALLDRGWKEFVEGEQNEYDWNLWWRIPRYRQCDYEDVMPWQRLNHFPNTTGITKKDNLARNMRRMKGVYGASVFNFTPLAFNLPNDYTKFVAEYTKIREQNKKEDKDKKEFWICKPADSSRGRGIFLFEDLSELTYDCSAVAQKYITNPCLIAGYKFDLRLYVLVTSFHPLIVYMYQEGIVRFSTEKYDLNSIGNLFSHLTNTSINKFSPSYTTDKERVGQGCKWTLTMLRNYFHQQNVDDEVLWQKISNVVILTLLAQVTSVPKVSGAFELFGFDVIIDSNLKPWLLEVNFNPALNEDCPVDTIVKRSMISNVVDILGFTEEDRSRGGEQYARLKAKQFDTRQRQQRFVPRPLPKSYLRKGSNLTSRIAQSRKLGKKEGIIATANKLKSNLVDSNKEFGSVQSSKSTGELIDDYDEEIARVCGISAAKPSTPRTTNNSKVQFKSPSLSKPPGRESSQERLRGKGATKSNIDNIWIPSIKESQKALASRRELIRKREEPEINSLSPCLGNGTPLSRVVSDLSKSDSKNSLTSSQSDITNSDCTKGTSDSMESIPPTRNSSSLNKSASKQVGSHSQNGQDKYQSNSLNRPSRAQGDRRKLDKKTGTTGAAIQSKNNPTRQPLFSRTAGLAAQRKTRGFAWPPARVGDFTLLFPFNDVTKRASYPTMELRTAVKETQKQLKRVICRRKAAKKLAAAGSPVITRKVSQQRAADSKGAKYEESCDIMWEPLRSATVTAVEA